MKDRALKDVPYIELVMGTPMFRGCETFDHMEKLRIDLLNFLAANLTDGDKEWAECGGGATMVNMKYIKEALDDYFGYRKD